SGLGATAISVSGPGTLRAQPTTGNTISAGASLALAHSSTLDMSADGNGGTLRISGPGAIGDVNGGATLNFDVGLNGGSSVADQLALTGAVTVSGANTIGISAFGTSGAFTTGAYPLISAPAGFTLNGGASFALSSSSVTINGQLYNLA